jgi:phytoene dehydrogenase-like protein
MSLRLQQYSQHLSKMPSVSQLSEICIPMVDEVAYKKRKLRVVTIGAGFSGLVFAHMIQHEQPDLQEFIDHTIYEANDDIGGTWKVNTYPGVQCDVPAHIYVSCLDRVAAQMLILPGVPVRPQPGLVQVLFRWARDPGLHETNV